MSRRHCAAWLHGPGTSLCCAVALALAVSSTTEARQAASRMSGTVFAGVASAGTLGPAAGVAVGVHARPRGMGGPLSFEFELGRHGDSRDAARGIVRLLANLVFQLPRGGSRWHAYATAGTGLSWPLLESDSDAEIDGAMNIGGGAKLPVGHLDAVRLRVDYRVFLARPAHRLYVGLVSGF